jgi:hypothetical protein
MSREAFPSAAVIASFRLFYESPIDGPLDKLRSYHTAQILAQMISLCVPGRQKTGSPARTRGVVLEGICIFFNVAGACLQVLKGQCRFLHCKDLLLPFNISTIGAEGPR